MNDSTQLPVDKRFVRETGTAGQIADLVEPALVDMGFRLVRVRIMGRDEQTLQIMAERGDGTISIEDCVDISRQLSPLLDAHDPISGKYVLEVSSPGIDRPLVRPSDFEDWAGYEVKVELTEMLDNRKRFRGTIEGYAEGEMRLEVDLDQIGRHVIGLPLAFISEARLVLTDDLVRESLRRNKVARRARGEDDDNNNDNDNDNELDEDGDTG
ncbi:MAG: ribosome maturation factor RimP [Alphaproteobacteria bacterium]|nr:ribosome maturation factor RimP [Alphaproteobacteria bacterium]